RRHTRSSRDWSSDVCSSDLDGIAPQQESSKEDHYLEIATKGGGLVGNAKADIDNIFSRIGSGGRPLGQLPQGQIYSGSPGKDGRSEERRVGKERTSAARTAQ